jgi:hypothetical protein
MNALEKLFQFKLYNQMQNIQNFKQFHKQNII